MEKTMLTLTWPTLGLCVRAAMLEEENPEVCRKMREKLPFESMMGHAVVSGETMWFPTRVIHSGPNYMVPRQIGDLYFFTSGQSVCITYGVITESAKVNKFAAVLPEDIPTLQQAGRLVYEKTINSAQKEAVPVRIALAQQEEGQR